MYASGGFMSPKGYRRRYAFHVLALIVIITTLNSCRDARTDLPEGLYAEMETSQGTILLALTYEVTPLTVMNFVGLAEGSYSFAKPSGRYYDGLIFHRVIDDFMIQGGDPQGNGTGGPGYSFPDEIDDNLLFDGPGVLAMANSGPDTNGSQFFITHVATPWLQGKHAVFGRVVEGQDVVDSIRQGDKIEKITIIRRGDAAEAFKPDEEMFNKKKSEVLDERRKAIEETREKVMEEIAARWPDAKVSPSGIRYVIKKEGTGNPPEAGTPVTVHYTGTFLDGSQFDSSRDRDQPFQFVVGQRQVIPGWDEMVNEMRVGERRTIVLPPETAYGSRGAGGVIPPDTWLVFDVELISF
jgi:peptidylprolyl isomerase